MILVLVVEVTRDDVIDVIAMPDGLMTAVRTVPVVRLVLGAVVVWRAVGRIRFRDRDLADR